MKRFIGSILISMAFIHLSCTDEEEIIRCDAQPAISESLLGTTSTSVTITSASILSNCLELRFSYIGCTGVATFDLAVAENVSNTPLPSRPMRIVLAQEGSCSITQSQTFRVDLTILQVASSNQLNLELEGWGEALVYGY